MKVGEKEIVGRCLTTGKERSSPSERKGIRNAIGVNNLVGAWSVQRDTVGIANVRLKWSIVSFLAIDLC